MKKHAYIQTCDCPKCSRERIRRAKQSDRTIPEVMQNWNHSRNPQRARIAREYWDAYESGRPMSGDDY